MAGVGDEAGGGGGSCPEAGSLLEQLVPGGWGVKRRFVVAREYSRIPDADSELSSFSFFFVGSRLIFFSF
jgi:hypothetical protein